MKRYLSAFATLFTAIFFTVMALTALAGTAVPGGATHENSAGPEGANGEKAQGGLVSGEVVDLDQNEGRIAILGDKGQTYSFKVADEAKKQLSRVKKGDRVNLNLVFRAIDIRPVDKGGG